MKPIFTKKGEVQSMNVLAIMRYKDIINYYQYLKEICLWI